eukprot:Opistho-2@50026
MTGAGISTESGIPDYRSPGVGLYDRANHKPITYMEFTRDHARRRRYWARSYIGYLTLNKSQPNATHNVLAQLELSGRMRCLITQNVDSLHVAAGSTRLIQLHGNITQVHCLGCGHHMSREAMQILLHRVNDKWSAGTDAIAPDGDAQLGTETDYCSFNIPPCPQCCQHDLPAATKPHGSVQESGVVVMPKVDVSGMLKPNLVFFGENVPRPRVDAAHAAIADSDGVLVLGSSLHVYSGYRFVKQAHELGKPIAIVNVGPTRADPLASLRLDGLCGEASAALFKDDRLWARP